MPTIKNIFLVISLIIWAGTPAYAGVSKVSSPSISAGDAEVEYSGTRYGDDRKSFNNKQSHTYELEYSFTDRFMLGLEAKSARQSPDGHEFEGGGLEAQYELTTQGDWWLDSAIKGEYFHNTQRHSADEAKVKLLFARSYGASRLTVNLGLEQEVGDHRQAGVGLSSAMQAKHKINSHISPGLEWHAEHGKLSNLGESDTREHYVGPILTGDLFELGGRDLEYTIGYFWGLTDDSADHAMRLQLGYEFSF